MNECETNPCGQNEVCMNTAGSYYCECIAGYEIQEMTCIGNYEPFLNSLLLTLQLLRLVSQKSINTFVRFDEIRKQMGTKLIKHLNDE